MNELIISVGILDAHKCSYMVEKYKKNKMIPGANTLETIIVISGMYIMLCIHM